MRRAAVLAVALLWSGCAGAGEGERGEESAMEPLVASLEVQVEPSTVGLILHVTNTGDEPLELTFPTSQRYDFVIRGAEGEPVWRWSEGMAFLQAISSATLAPGESWALSAEWNPEAGSGTYEAEGFLTARDVDVRQSAGFELP